MCVLLCECVFMFRFQRNSVLSCKFNSSRIYSCTAGGSTVVESLSLLMLPKTSRRNLRHALREDDSGKHESLKDVTCILCTNFLCT